MTMARGKQTSEEVKAAVLAALLTGAGVNETARALHLSPNTVSRIKSDITPHRLTQVDTEKRERIDDLLLGLMATNIHALSKIAETISEPDYLKKQPAESIAVLYREIAATEIRLLEAASAAGIGEASDGEGEETR
jgi:transposase-like protein